MLVEVSFNTIISIGVILVAVVVLVMNWRTQKAAEAVITAAAQSGPMTERWTQAVLMLAHSGTPEPSSVETRLGAIYSIEQIAQESPVYRGPAMELLAAYVREHAQAGRSGLQPTSEIQSVLSVLGRSSTEGLDLRRTALWGADLEGAKLAGVNLSQARLRGACLAGASLVRGRLREVNLDDADLVGAELTGAVLRGARLVGADLSGAVLRGADLQGADLTRARLRGADLSEASLIGAKLVDALLDDAKLNGTVMDGVDMGEDNLPGTRSEPSRPSLNHSGGVTTATR